MVEIKWNKMFLLLMLVLQFSEAFSTHHSLSSIVREGGEVNLSCENVTRNHQNCDTTTWIFSNSKIPLAVELVTLGQIKNEIRINRLSLTANCSLVIKKVTVEDAGRYDCRQFISGTQQGPGAEVDLSVVTVTERKSTDKVTLNCSVETNGRCRHTAKWLLKGRDVDKENPNIKTSQSSCFANDIKDPLTFSLRPSDENTKTTTTTSSSTTTANNQKDDTTATGPPANDINKLSKLWWLFIVVPVVAVALLIIAVKVIRTRRTKGKNTQRNDNVALTSESTVAHSAHETSHDMADPEDGVSYASISYTNTANSKAKIRSKKDDDDTVTYSTVKASSPDPSSLYATVNHPKTGP